MMYNLQSLLLLLVLLDQKPWNDCVLHFNDGLRLRFRSFDPCVYLVLVPISPRTVLLLLQYYHYTLCDGRNRVVIYTTTTPHYP